VELMDFIATIEQELGKKAVINFLPIQAGDVPETTANITKAKKLLGYEPKVNIQTGVKNFIEWYKTYYDVRL
jgi:UDP-glucuronate 4-epimerase